MNEQNTEYARTVALLKSYETRPPSELGGAPTVIDLIAAKLRDQDARLEALEAAANALKESASLLRASAAGVV